MRRFQSGIGLVVLSASAWAAFATAARAATCGPDPAEADVAFVGTLTGSDGSGQLGTFAVEEVWKGSGVGAVVQVIGDPEQWSAPLAATRYLVIAAVVEGNLRVGIDCNNAYLWDDSFTAFRPASAHPPSGSSTGAPIPLQFLVAAGTMLAIGLVSLFAFRRTRRADTDG